MNRDADESLQIARAAVALGRITTWLAPQLLRGQVVANAAALQHAPGDGVA